MSWWTLKSINDEAKTLKASYNSSPPDACPNDGQPLEVTSSALPANNGIRFCRFCGYRWTGGQRLT